jgi:hypothetical protein
MNPIEKIAEAYPGFSIVNNRCQTSSSKTYVVLRSNAKNLKFLHRFSKGVLLSIATFLSGGLALISKNFRDYWEEVFSGKEIKHITEFMNDTQKKTDKCRDIIQKTPISIPVLNLDKSIIQPAPQKENSILAKALNFDPSEIDFSSPENASLAFVLLNSDFLDLDLSDYATTSKNALALMIHSLKKQRGKLPEDDQEKIENLLQKFQCAYEVEILRDALGRNNNTTTEFNAAKHDLEQRLMERLEKEEVLYLASGWVGSPAGHNINLELTPFRNKEGVLLVRGRIQNRGAGIEKHKAFINWSLD